LESGLEPLIDFDKDEFRGREALIRQQQAGVQRRLVRLEVSGNETFDARGQEPVRTQDGDLIGRTTSGGFGHCLSKSLAMAYLSSGAIEVGSDLEIKLMNDWFPASIFEPGDGM
jgi:dimethylglycine dehydrogenase